MRIIRSRSRPRTRFGRNTDKHHKVIEWISIYWFSRAGPGAAGRIYYEMASGGTGNAMDGHVWQSVPLGLSYFPGEVVRLPKA